MNIQLHIIHRMIQQPLAIIDCGNDEKVSKNITFGTIEKNIGVYDKEILVAALLHDVMDEAGTTYEEISNLYGKTVSQYVQEMTVKKELTLKEQKKLQIIQAFHQTPSVAIIKLSDKLSNLGTLAKTPPTSWTRDRIDQYFQWAQSVIENLPEANPLLKQAVKDVIFSYWEKQEQSKKA